MEIPIDELTSIYIVIHLLSCCYQAAQRKKIFGNLQGLCTEACLSLKNCESHCSDSEAISTITSRPIALESQ